MFLLFFEIQVNDLSKIIVFYSHVYISLKCSHDSGVKHIIIANSMIKSSFEVIFSVFLFDSSSRLRSSESSLLEKVIATQESVLVIERVVFIINYNLKNSTDQCEFTLNS